MTKNAAKNTPTPDSQDAGTQTTPPVEGEGLQTPPASATGNGSDADAAKAPPADKQEEVKPKVPRALQNVTKAKGFKAYITSEKHTIPIDVLVRGETVNGHWSAKDGHVEFSVPNHLVEGFEMHYHFKSGNIVVAE
jgi:hypothetical protein